MKIKLKLRCKSIHTMMLSRKILRDIINSKIKESKKLTLMQDAREALRKNKRKDR